MKCKEYFVGIDSDGTVFDSMKIKHVDAFIPSMIKIWNLDEYVSDVFRVCERINLYSSTRGINRFDGLLLAFSELGNKVKNVDFKDLGSFLNSDYGKSEDGLDKYLKVNHSRFLEQVLLWSKKSDEIFLEKTKNLGCFPNVKPTLEKIYNKAFTAVISSASYGSLKRDWDKDGLTSLTDQICSQEQGSKSRQLKISSKNKYKGKILMIGDAPGDQAAASCAGAKFYPIIPGREAECWEKLHNTFIDLFFSGLYNDEIEKGLSDEFYNTLAKRSRYEN